MGSLNTFFQHGKAGIVQRKARIGQLGNERDGCICLYGGKERGGCFAKSQYAGIGNKILSDVFVQLFCCHFQKNVKEAAADAGVS